MPRSGKEKGLSSSGQQSYTNVSAKEKTRKEISHNEKIDRSSKGKTMSTSSDFQEKNAKSTSPAADVENINSPSNTNSNNSE